MTDQPETTATELMNRQTKRTDQPGAALAAEQYARQMVTDAVQSLDLAMVLFDAELNFVFANQKWHGTFFPDDPPGVGAPALLLLRQLVDQDYYAMPDGMTANDFCDQMIELVRSYANNVPMVANDGTIMHASVHETGLGGYLIAFSDVTEEVRAKEEAEHQRDKTERANVRLRDALESIGEGFALFDKNDNLILANELYRSANPAAAHLMTLGRPRKEIIAGMMTGGDLLGVDDWIDSFERETWAGDAATPRRYEINHRDGRTFMASRGRTAEGGCTITWLDITDHKRAEERTHAILTNVVQALDIGVALYDADLNFVFGNQKHQEIFDQPSSAPREGETLNDTLSRLIDNGAVKIPRDSSTQQYADHLIQQLKNYQKRTTIELTDGRSLEASALKTDLGGYLLTLNDITESLRAGRAEREADHLVRTIVESSPTTFLVSRIETGEILYCPPASLERFGHLTTTLGFFLKPEDRQDYLDALMVTGSLNDYRVKFRRGDGSIMDGLTSARVIDYKGENVIVSSTRDITEHLAMEAELVRQRELAHQNEKLSALGELLAGVAHELNNPLSIVVGYAMMLQNADLDPKARRQIDNVAQAAERCARIVKAFLAMARQRPAVLKRCSLNELLMAALDMVGHRLRAAGVDVVLELDPTLPDVEADEDHIIQVFTNLIANAEQALAGIAGERKLHLRTFLDRRARKAVVRLADNGPGILASVLPRIFEPFFTTKEIGSGTGIGLAFCHQVIASHGGRMTVRSPQGKGAQFYVRLSLATGLELPEIAPTSAPQDHAGRVLVVDDEAGVAELIGDILSDAGYDVEVRNSALDALELVKTQHFDAIISDIRMPDLDGPGFHSELMRIDPALARRTGFVTGDTLSKNVAAFLTTSEQPHLEKPVTPLELLDLVAGLIANRRD